MMILYLILFAINGITFITSLLIEIARMPENDEEYNENKEEINN